MIEPLGEEVRGQMRRFGVEGGAADLVEAWPAAVGEEIARSAWPARVQGDGTLVVHVRDAIWGFELTQRAAEIRARLPGSPALKFVPGPLPDGGDPGAAESRDAAPRATLEQEREAAGFAAEIADEELRELVARAAAASLARAAADRSV
jgi:hypothetical protein